MKKYSYRLLRRFYEKLTGSELQSCGFKKVDFFSSHTSVRLLSRVIIRVQIFQPSIPLLVVIILSPSRFYPVDVHALDEIDLFAIMTPHFYSVASAHYKLHYNGMRINCLFIIFGSSLLYRLVVSRAQMSRSREMSARSYALHSVSNQLHGSIFDCRYLTHVSAFGIVEGDGNVQVVSSQSEFVFSNPYFTGFVRWVR